MAGTHCTLVMDQDTPAIVFEQGDCKTRHAPQSTFKIPLALMGYDADILKNEHTPAWPFEEGATVNRPEDKFETDPTRWEKESIVWFSQKLTRELGMKNFKHYVDIFDYGNRDVSGDPNQDNGLTQAWLSSSLQISPIEQIGFLRGLLERKYEISSHAYEMTKAIIPQFEADGWTVYGKTGTGFSKKQDGTLDRNKPQGWFVGWAYKADQTVVFAAFKADNEKQEGFAGPRVRDAFLKQLPVIMAADRHNEH